MLLFLDHHEEVVLSAAKTAPSAIPSRSGRQFASNDYRNAQAADFKVKKMDLAWQDISWQRRFW
jgi:hypothetical protein